MNARGLLAPDVATELVEALQRQLANKTLDAHRMDVLLYRGLTRRVPDSKLAALTRIDEQYPDYEKARRALLNNNRLPVYSPGQYWMITGSGRGLATRLVPHNGGTVVVHPKLYIGATIHRDLAKAALGIVNTLPKLQHEVSRKDEQVSLMTPLVKLSYFLERQESLVVHGVAKRDVPRTVRIAEQHLQKQGAQLDHNSVHDGFDLYFESKGTHNRKPIGTYHQLLARATTQALIRERPAMTEDTVVALIDSYRADQPLELLAKTGWQLKNL